MASLVRYLRALERGPAAARPGFELPEGGGGRPLELLAAADLDDVDDDPVERRRSPGGAR